MLFPSDGSVVFAFSSPLLRNLGYRCASALHAQWTTSNPFTSVDQVAPFDLAVVPDPGTAGAGPGPASATNEAASAVATGGPASATASPLPPDTVFVSAGLTARVAATREAFADCSAGGSRFRSPAPPDARCARA